MIKIAIAGNPNSGKTTLFNQLSGQRARVGNYAGVTVQTASSQLKKQYCVDQEVLLIDLPGSYGMDAYTLDEQEAIRYIENEKIDLIINVIDSTALERSLVFTLQLINTKIPIIVALNKHDLSKRNGHSIDIQQLSQALDTQVIFTEALHGKGISELIDISLKSLHKERTLVTE